MHSPVMRRCGPAYVVMLFVFFTIFPSAVRGGPAKVTFETAVPQKLSLTVGKSVIVSNSGPVKRVSLGSQEIADAVVLTPQQISVIGKAPGVTNLIIWGMDDKVSAILDIQVSPDVSRLGEMVQKILPEEKDIHINAAHDTLTLSGTVSSTSSLSHALALAEAHLPKDGKVVNLLEVAGVQQVMLEVRVAEVSHSLLRRLGVNWSYFSSSGKIGINMLGNLTNFGQLNVPGTSGEQGISSAINYLFTFAKGGTTWAVFIDALKETGLVKVLASPTLITLSGKPASFLAGGEIPIPVPQSTGLGTNTITIEYKPFGVALTFTPIVLGSKKINMQVAPEVSEPDFTNSLQLSGFIVPSFATRRVSTNIELDDGQSFVIAGLLRDDTRKIISKYPLLGDIPVLGAVFRSTSWQRNETELIVIATPRLVKPVDMTKQPLPTDKYSDPNDFEFYLNGKSEGSGREPTEPIK